MMRQCIREMVKSRLTMTVSLLFAVCLLSFTTVKAQEQEETMSDSPAETQEQGKEDEKEQNLSWWRRIIRGFDRIDTTYIEPQHYNWSVMLQGTSEVDRYTILSKEQSLTLSPDRTVKVGPYFGWRWVFLGYTIDLKNINLFNGSLKRELNFSIYSSQIGVDLFYRHLGDNYKLREVDMGDNIDTGLLEGTAYDGINAGITGVNLYYIFNHGRFSYPAAFSQSTLQKKSCGSWIAGVGYRTCTLELDYEKLQHVIDDRLGKNAVPLDSGLLFNKIKYQDFNLSCGYAYNLVFARKCLFCASGQAALGYKKSRGDVYGTGNHGFSFDNVNLDGIGRFALVYNNMRWYAGASAILHTNNYRTSRFRSFNVFGSMNLYLGYNFGLRKQYKNKT